MQHLAYAKRIIIRDRAAKRRPLSRHRRGSGMLGVKGDKLWYSNKNPAGKKPMPAPSPSAANSVLTTAKRLARESKPQKVTAARLDSAEVLKAVRNETITVTRNGKPAAVVISPARYRGLMRVLAAFMERKD